jgi:hypothetical protein
MSTLIIALTVAVGLFAAVLLVYASFDSLVSPVANSEGHTQYMRSVRALGVRGAIIALIGTYLVVFLT